MDRKNNIWLCLPAFSILFFFWICARSFRRSSPEAGFLERESPIITWLRAQSSWPENLGLRSFPHSKRKVRGVASAVAAKEGDVVLAIPKDRLICAQGSINLTIELVRLARTPSVFSEYLESLPTLDDYKHWHPFYAPAELLKRFEILELVETLQHRVQVVNETYRHFGRGAGASWETWQWAQHVVLTRNFGVEGQNCLVPGADLLNCAQDFNVLWDNVLHNGSDGRQYFEMTAINTIPSGEEMVTTYGPHRDNQHLFWQYGFFMEHNKDLITSLEPNACLRTPNFDEIVDNPCDDPSIECGLRRVYLGSCAYSVGYAYEIGLNGTRRDAARAKKWYVAALAEGDESAREKVEGMFGKMEQ